MRRIIDMQMKIGETAIANIKFDPKSRDEIPKLLRGLQSIYCDKGVCGQVFDALLQLIPPHIDTNTGREGMDLWKIFVLGALRLTCNWDYDKLHEIANNHDKLRRCSVTDQWMRIINMGFRHSKTISLFLRRRSWTESTRSSSNTDIKSPVKKRRKTYWQL